MRLKRMSGLQTLKIVSLIALLPVSGCGIALGANETSLDVLCHRTLSDRDSLSVALADLDRENPASLPDSIFVNSARLLAVLDAECGA